MFLLQDIDCAIVVIGQAIPKRIVLSVICLEGELTAMIIFAEAIPIGAIIPESMKKMSIINGRKRYLVMIT